MKKSNKKIKNKLYLASLILILGFLICCSIYPMISKPEITPIDCSKPFTALYLKPDEREHASNLLNKLQNTYIIIPEEKEILSRTDFHQCSGYNIDEILNSFGWTK
jgi:hypothetical protein